MMAFKGGGRTSGDKRTGITSGFVGIGKYLITERESGRDRIAHFGSTEDYLDLDEAMMAMKEVSSLRKTVTQPVFHWGFSLPKDKAGNPLESLTPHQWEAVAYHSIKALGLECHQVAWVVHDDAGHQHIHLVANRVPLDPDLKTWRPRNDHYRMRATARWAEREFDLRRYLNPTPNEYHRRPLKALPEIAERAGREREDLVEAERGSHQLATNGNASSFDLDASEILLTETGPKVFQRTGAGESGPRIVRRTDTEFRVLRATGREISWAAAVPTLLEAASWDDLHRGLETAGFSLEPSLKHPGGMILKHASGVRKALSKIHPSLSGPKLNRRLSRVEEPRESAADFFRNRTFWDDFTQSTERAISWPDLETRSSEMGIELSLDNGDLRARDPRTGVTRILSDLSPALSTERLGQKLGAEASEHLRSTAEPAGEERARPAAIRPLAARPLTVDGLLNQLQNHHAVWTLAEARRVARVHPNGEQIIEQLAESPRLVKIDAERFSTVEIAKIEDRVFRMAEKVSKAGGHKVPLRAEDDLQGSHLEAALSALEDSGLTLIEGPAGSGKTTLAKAIADSYAVAGYQVYGAAPTGKAAAGLAAETGMDARTLASWQKTWSNQLRQPAKGVILVDEASMLSLHEMSPLLRHAEEVGHKVILIGDRKQLRPVRAGDPFRRLVEDYGAKSLDEIHRQTVPWMKEASNLLLKGDVEGSLQAYDSHGRIHWMESRQDARSALAMQYFEDRLKHPEKSSIVMAYRNRDVKALNEEIRSLRRSRGELESGILLHSREYAAGDRILFRKNDRRSVYDVETGLSVPVQNGDLGTLVSATREELKIRLDSGKTVAFSPEEYSDLTYGYAVSLYKSQGVTTDRAHVLADNLVDAQGWMVASTRHRSELQIYAGKDHFRSLEEMTEAFSRTPPPDLIRDYRSGLDLGEIGQDKESIAAPEAEAPRSEGEELERELRRLLWKIKRSRQEIPTEAGLGRLLQSADGLLAGIDASSDPRLCFFRDHIWEQMDLLRHSYHAVSVMTAAEQGLQEDVDARFQAFVDLPEVRFLLGDPTTKNLSAEISRPDLPEYLQLNFTAAWERRSALEQISEDLPELQKLHWQEQQRILDQTLRSADKLAEVWSDLNRRLDVAGPELMADVLLQLAKTERMLDALLRPRPTGRDFYENLKTQVEVVVAKREGSLDPAAEVLRAVRSLQTLDTLTLIKAEKVTEVKQIATEETLRKRIVHLEVEGEELVKKGLGKVFRNGKAVYESFTESVDKEGMSATLQILETKPESLGKLRVFLGLQTAKGNAKTAVAELRQWQGKRDREQKELERLHRAAATVRKIRAELKEMPERDELLARLHRLDKGLSSEQRAALPPGARKELVRIRDQVHQANRSYLKILGRVAGAFASLAAGVTLATAKLMIPGWSRQLREVRKDYEALRKGLPSFLRRKGTRAALPVALRKAYLLKRPLRSLAPRRGERVSKPPKEKARGPRSH